jgi:chemotaxis protein MotA
MDLATVFGFVGGIAAILLAMAMDGAFLPFVSLHAFVIVFVGGFFAVMYSTPMDVFLASPKAAATAFRKQDTDIGKLAAQMSEFATVARKDGLMALEGQDIPNKFVARGVQMLIDGADEQTMVKLLQDDIVAMKARHQAKQDVFKAWVELGPAYGMIGTLLGLVVMMGNMSDPSLIGKGMATALLGTLYGAVAANALFGPLSAKLKNNTAREVAYCEAAIEGLKRIVRSQSPRLVLDALAVRIPASARASLQAAA